MKKYDGFQKKESCQILIIEKTHNTFLFYSVIFYKVTNFNIIISKYTKQITTEKYLNKIEELKKLSLKILKERKNLDFMIDYLRQLRLQLSGFSYSGNSGIFLLCI